jgi:hypothetical protein
MEEADHPDIEPWSVPRLGMGKVRI